jgi:hypothetical protein
MIMLIYQTKNLNVTGYRSEFFEIWVLIAFEKKPGTRMKIIFQMKTLLQSS